MHSTNRSAAFPEPCINKIGRFCSTANATCSIVFKSPSATTITTGIRNSTNKYVQISLFAKISITSP